MSSNELTGTALTVREIFTGRKYSIEYYQREYTWNKSNVDDLLNDLFSRFRSEFNEGDNLRDVDNYNSYFLGPIVTGKINGYRSLVDGQQRLTTLMLLIIHLNNLWKDEPQSEDLKHLILSVKYGCTTFNIDVKERNEVMTAILKEEEYDTTNQSKSVRKIYERYEDITNMIPEELEGKALVYFTNWLLERVMMVEIKTSNPEMALEIFEAMNDRGSSLTSTDMLKGFLLSKLDGEQDIKAANELWRSNIVQLSDLEKDGDSHFFKYWLRSKYADTIRERKKNATPGDFDTIGTAFHRWVRDNRGKIGLRHAEDYHKFINRDFEKMCSRYIQLRRASWNSTPGLEQVFYNHNIGIPLQYLPIMATIITDDDEQTFLLKTRLVATYLDIFIARRIVRYRRYGYSTILYHMFNLAKTVRDQEPSELSEKLRELLIDENESSYFDPIKWFRLTMRNGRAIRYLLARMTAWIEQECGKENRFPEYIDRYRRDPYEIEHIWANKFVTHGHDKEFANEHDFWGHRNKIGGLLLLPKSFNASYGAKTYEEKLEHYHARNLLASSLHPLTYENNPGFNSFRARTGLPFKSYQDGFSKEDIEERTYLYGQICEQVWDPDRLLRIKPDSGE